MRILLLLFIFSCGTRAISQEIRRISKATEDIASSSKNYENAIASSKNMQLNTVVYKNKDSLLFLKDLKLFFENFEKSQREEEGSNHFVGNGKKIEYILFVSNTGYTDSFYYEFEDKKNSMSFTIALRTFMAAYKWENSKKAKFMHRGIYTFK